MLFDAEASFVLIESDLAAGIFQALKDAVAGTVVVVDQEHLAVSELTRRRVVWLLFIKSG